MSSKRHHPEEKLRGILRRLRSLRAWSEHFRGYFPSRAELSSAGGSYWNWKLPIHQLMVEGWQSTPAMKKEIAQLLVDACGFLVAAKPEWAGDVRVTCLVVVPDMFSSEVCLYLTEEHFASKFFEGTTGDGVVCSTILGRTLSEEWGLHLPAGIHEHGTHIEFAGYGNGEEAYSGDHWLFGELMPPSIERTSKRLRLLDAAHVER